MKVLMIGFNLQEDTFPLGLSYLKNYALKNHPDVVFKIKEFGFGNRFDYDTNKNLELKIVSYILLENPDLVAFSSYVWNGKMIKLLSRSIKKCNPHIKILIGGVEITSNDLDEFIDYIIIGEGELAFSNLISYLKNELPIGKVNNLFSHKINTPEMFISDLDTIPFPYKTWGGKSKFNVVKIETTRGCNYNCKYCNYARKKYRQFSMSYLEKNIKYLFDNFEFDNLTILDANFNIDKKRMNDILSIIEYNMDKKLRVSFELKPELIDAEMISILKGRKFKISCELGLQSIDEEVINNSNRFFSIEKVKQGLKLLNDNGINYKIDLMYGLPNDNFFRFLRSFNFLVKYSNQTKIPAHHFVVLNNTEFSNYARYDPDNSSKVIKTETQTCVDFYKTQLFLNLINKQKHYYNP